MTTGPRYSLAERALELDNLLEVTSAMEMELEKKLIKPSGISRKDRSEENKPPIVYIEGIELPGETRVTIAVNRISYLRMLKSSLYTP